MMHLKQKQIMSGGFCFSALCEYFPSWDYGIMSSSRILPHPPILYALGPGGWQGQHTLDPTPIFLRVPQHGMNAQCLRFVLFEISGQKRVSKSGRFLRRNERTQVRGGRLH